MHGEKAGSASNARTQIFIFISVDGLFRLIITSLEMFIAPLFRWWGKALIFYMSGCVMPASSSSLKSSSTAWLKAPLLVEVGIFVFQINRLSPSRIGYRRGTHGRGSL